MGVEVAVTVGVGVGVPAGFGPNGIGRLQAKGAKPKNITNSAARYLFIISCAED